MRQALLIIKHIPQCFPFLLKNISVTSRCGVKIQPAMDSTGRDLSDEVEKIDPGVTCDATGQVKSNTKCLIFPFNAFA